MNTLEADESSDSSILHHQTFVDSPQPSLHIMTGTTRLRELDRRVLHARSTSMTRLQRAESVDAFFTERRTELLDVFARNLDDGKEFNDNALIASNRHDTEDRLWGRLFEDCQEVEEDAVSVASGLDEVFSDESLWNGRHRRQR